jgi:hypothetical protein
MYCSSAQIISAFKDRRCSFARVRMASMMRSGRMNVAFFLGSSLDMLSLYKHNAGISRSIILAGEPDLEIPEEPESPDEAEVA